jgi:hypothetical protein
MMLNRCKKFITCFALQVTSYRSFLYEAEVIGQMLILHLLLVQRSLFQTSLKAVNLNSELLQSTMLDRANLARARDLIKFGIQSVSKLIANMHCCCRPHVLFVQLDTGKLQLNSNMKRTAAKNHIRFQQHFVPFAVSTKSDNYPLWSKTLQ